MKDIVLTPRGPKPIGPYSQAVKANGFFSSPARLRWTH